MKSTLIIYALIFQVLLIGCGGGGSGGSGGGDVDSLITLDSVLCTVTPNAGSAPTISTFPGRTVTYTTTSSSSKSSIQKIDDYITDSDIAYARMGSISRSVVQASGSVVTDANGGFSIPNLPSGAQVITCTVSGEGTSAVFEIPLDSNGQVDLSKGVSVISGTDFSSQLPSTRTREITSSSLPESYASLSGTTIQQAILNVIHKSIIGRFLNDGTDRLKVKGTTDLVTRTISGPDGGQAVFSLLRNDSITNDGYRNTVNPRDDDYPYDGFLIADSITKGSSSIAQEKLSIITFDNYQEDGLTINGSVAFIYGFRLNAFTYYVYDTDPAWGNTAGDRASDYTGITRIQELVNWWAQNSKDYFGTPGENVVWNNSLKYAVSLPKWPDYSGYTVSGRPIVNNLTVSGNYSGTVTASFTARNYSNGLPAGDYWKDQLRMSYAFDSSLGGGSVDLDELTGPGIYHRTYYDYHTKLAAIAKPTVTSSWQTEISGNDGGKAVMSIRGVKIEGSSDYNVAVTHEFIDYSENGIVLNGTISQRTRTTNGGVIVSGTNTASQVKINGRYKGTARHYCTVFDNSGTWQNTDWYFVDDYTHGWDRATITIPVSFGI